MARSYAELEIGEELPPVSRLMTQETINRYADVSGDHNPIHVDPEFAKNTMFGGTIAHGIISLSFVFQALTDWLGRADLDGSKMRITFVNPVRPGDKVTAKGTVTDKKEAAGRKLATCELWIENQRQERCIVVEAEVAF